MRADLVSPADIARDSLTGRDFPLARPSDPIDAAHRPVRGDLAHIRCAGRIFVPHYAVPMPHHVIADGTVLARAGRTDGEVLGHLAAGALFNVLDIAGGWAWGQEGEDGLVGYVPITALSPA